MPNQVADFTVASRTDLLLMANNTWQPVWTFTSLGVPFNVSGYQYELMVKDSTGAVIFNFINAVFTRPATNQIGLVVTNTQMNIAPGTYTYQMNATYPDGSVRTWYIGAIILNASLI